MICLGHGGPWFRRGVSCKRVVCNERAHFADMCFACDFDDDRLARCIYAFVLAPQNPLATVFLKCYLGDVFEYGGQACQAHKLGFVSGTGAFDEREELFVQHVLFRGLVVETCCDLLGAHVVISQLWLATRTSRRSSSKRHRVTTEGIHGKLPWPTEADIKDFLKAHRPPAKAKSP